MKKSFYLMFLVAVLVTIIGCKKDDPISNGLSDDINALVPASILEEMENLGMPINPGSNPPIIEGDYFGSPIVLRNSNVSGDQPGDVFSNLELLLSEQNNEDLTIKASYQNSVVSGGGTGSFISGEGNSFSVFVETTSFYLTSSAKLVYVFSGTLGNGGIEDLYISNFMIDNNGNSLGVWLENGKGRVLYDQDGFSEEL